MSKTTIVPGVHDLIPPDGRMTLELLHPDTGRVRKRVQAENAIMDWFRKNVVVNGGRGNPSPYSLTNANNSLDQFNPFIADKPMAWYANKPYGWPASSGPNVVSTWLWATNQNVTPDSTRLFIPTNNAAADVTSGTKVDLSFAPDGVQFKRGSVQFASCLRTWARTRIVTEFGLAYGNGIYRSLGFGSLVNQRNGTGMRATPCMAGHTPNGAQPNSALGIVYGVPGSNSPNYFSRGCVDYEDGGWWGWRMISGNDGLYRQTATDTTGGARLVLTANHPGSGGQISYAVNGSDFWVARNQTLYRCVKPVADVAMTVTNTYALAGTLGAQTIFDIAIDRVANKVFLLTSSHVHVINGVTGAAESSFAHGITIVEPNYAAIEWSKPESLLFINPARSTGGTDSGWGGATAATSLVGVDGCPVYAFTTLGVASTKALMLSQYGPVNTNNAWYSGYVCLNDWGMAIQTRLISGGYLMPYGPSMASHALLGADFEKTAADALRITYDFDFA
jgi:hypothetical protein